MATRIQAGPPRPRGAQMPSTVKDLPLDDIVPSLPPDWQPPAFSTQEVPVPADVSEHDLNEKVSLM